MIDTFEKFSNHYKKSLKEAAELARELNQKQINPEHIFYGLLNQKGSVGAELFSQSQTKAGDIKRQIIKNSHQARTYQDYPLKNFTPQFSDKSKKIIQKSIHIAYINKHQYIGTEHLLAALLEGKDEKIKKILAHYQIGEKKLSQQIVSSLKTASKLPDLTSTFKVIKKSKDQEKIAPPNILEVFGHHLTGKKSQKDIDPVIGRDEEIERIIQILARRTKNNPILLGDPGVGKTAIVEGLAKKILAGQVPESLKNKKIYAIDLAYTIAGTMYRGEFESRLKQIIEEVKNRPEVILFIDEIHNIVGAGATSGSMDAANILKPALARGEIRCIGATTFADYRRSIENDTALERRFQAIKIAEPTNEDAQNILLGVKKYFEKFHGVKITNEAIQAAVNLSQKYLPEKFLPDKAIDLIDEAAAKVKVNKKASPQQALIQKLEKEIKIIAKQKAKAVAQENYELAMNLKQELQLKQQTLKTEKNKLSPNQVLSGAVKAEDIAKIITKMTGIPVGNLLVSEKKAVLKLDQKLNQKVIGQAQATKIIAGFIKRAKAGLMPTERPLASFMFAGPSGVGKTYTARLLAQAITGDANGLIKIDMSEYSEKFNISKLIGAPAGYVGYKESGELTEKVKHQPHAVVLFDEIEKANPEIFDLLLQILEDGYLTDATGAKINFQNTVIIMTTNLGSDQLINNQPIGFDKEQTNQKTDETVNAEIKNHFKIEFLNRLDKIIYFNQLDINHLKKITKLELKELADRMATKKITLNFASKVITLIAKKSHQPNQGARAIKKTIQKLIEEPLADKILSDDIKSNSAVDILVKNQEISLKIN